MKPSEAMERFGAVGLPVDERSATFLMLGNAVARGDAVGARKVARFRMIRLRQEFSVERFLMLEYWRSVWLAVRSGHTTNRQVAVR